ncbi:MAG TPA: hypothetical protein VLJ12_01620 [Burkholderiales bacterium]|nr:hypothetical protein [Burkholderiales bacterium]
MMPANVKVIHAHEFVRARPGGVLNLEASEQLLLDVARAAEGRDKIEILIDTRQAEGQLGAADLWFLADRLARHRRAFSGKTAVLCPMERFDRARFFALLADSKGFDVEAFTSYEEAIAWLSGDQDR